VRIETVPPDRIDTDVAKTMHAFYASTVDRYFYGRRYLNEAFFQQIARTLRERMAWVVASRDGTPIAGAFNVVKGHRLYGRYWGAREELPFLHFNVCYYHGIRHAIEHRLRVFEPGAGGEHKYVRGFLPTLTRSVHWIAHPRMSAVVRAHTEREAEAVRRHVEEGRAGGPYRPNGSPDPST
jgi:predicted N-acyltransferase